MQRRRLPVLPIVLATMALGLILFFMLWSPKRSSTVAEVGEAPADTSDEIVRPSLSVPISGGQELLQRVGSTVGPSNGTEDHGATPAAVDPPEDQEPLFRLSVRFVDERG